MYDGIVVSSGQYQVWVKYQDGTDYLGVFGDLNAAKTAWIKAHKAWNGCDRDPSEVKVYDVLPAIEMKLVERK